MKPILAKPFPEGASDAVVCEAISNTKEKDLWSRFGHIVPLYIRGALYVLEAGPRDAARLVKFIEKDYVHPHMVQQATCGELTLLYLRDMVNESVFGGRPFGRLHLSAELDKKLGIKTRESFQFEYDNVRLAEYCRVDAEACDALLKLDTANSGRGLCFGVGMMLGLDSKDPSYPEFLDKCRGQEKRILTCSQMELRGGASQECERVIRNAFSTK